MAAGLPEFIDPLLWAESGHRLQGRMRVRGMSRLKAFLHSPDGDGEVELDMQAGIDEQGVRFLRGRIQGVLTVTCQRCLEAMELPVDLRVALGLVTSHSQTDNLPEPYEGLVLESRSIPLMRIVEDELLLALPIVAMHAEPACRPGAPSQDQGRDDTGGERPNPFAVLGRLKK